MNNDKAVELDNLLGPVEGQPQGRARCWDRSFVFTKSKLEEARPLVQEFVDNLPDSFRSEDGSVIVNALENRDGSDADLIPETVCFFFALAETLGLVEYWGVFPISDLPIYRIVK